MWPWGSHKAAESSMASPVSPPGDLSRAHTQWLLPARAVVPDLSTESKDHIAQGLWLEVILPHSPKLTVWGAKGKGGEDGARLLLVPEGLWLPT